jgi:hypothetical protein
MISACLSKAAAANSAAETQGMTERKPTDDELKGMAWWNSMTEQQRAAAMQVAKANTAAEAWDWQKQAWETEGFDVKTAYPRRGGVTQDEKSWTAGYRAGHSGKPGDSAPPEVDHLSWVSGLIEGKADRDAGHVRFSRKPSDPSR